MSQQNSEYIINQTKRLVESDKRSEIRLNANGGNSILVVCEPKQEFDFIQTINNLCDSETYSIIDLNSLIIQFVTDNKELLADTFKLLKGSVHQIFKTPESEEGNDLFKFILGKISNSYDNNKIPVLIHSGALYGSGIDNIHLMENELVMKSNLPLIILYPATKEGEKLLFLSKRPASKYRCMIVN